MPSQVGLQIDGYTANKIQAKATGEGLTSAGLVGMYLNYCLVNHQEVIRFENQIGKNLTEIIEPVTALAKRPSGVAKVLLDWMAKQE